MSDVRFREARQDYPREVAFGHYGIAGFTSELVVPGIESGTADERWEFGDAYADAAQAWAGIGNEGDEGTPANELCVNGERARGISGSHRRIGTDRKEMENEMKKILGLYFVAQSECLVPKTVLNNMPSRP